MVNFYSMMRRIVWVIMATLLSIDGVVILEATAQNRRLRRGRLAPIQQQQETSNTDTMKDLSQHLLEIARSVSDQAENRMVDLVFVIDGSRGMVKEIAEMQRKLVDVANVFEGELIDYQFAATSYERIVGVPKIATRTFESDLVGIQAWLRELRISRGAETGYGLDAILQTLRETNFRSQALKHLLVLTNSRLQTAWTAGKAKDRIVKEIVDLCKRDDIHINIIGVSESAQIQLTARTGGEFYAISGNDKKRIKFFNSGDFDKSILKIEGVFKLTAQHIVRTVKKSADIIFMFDSSLRMAAKADKTKVAKICGGIDEMADVLNKAGVDYRFGVIRFWAAIGNGDSVVTLTQPPLNTDQVKKLFRAPKQGERNLLGAVVKGVPKLNTPMHRQLVLVIVTDGSPEVRVEEKYTVSQAIGVCRRVGAQVNVIGQSSMGARSYSGRFGGRANLSSVEFQKRAPAITNGVFFVMPGSQGRH